MNNDALSGRMKEKLREARNRGLEEAGVQTADESRADEDKARLDRLINNDSVPDKLKDRLRERYDQMYGIPEVQGEGQGAGSGDGMTMQRQDQEPPKEYARFEELMNNSAVPNKMKRKLRENFPELAALYDKGRG